MWGNLEESGYMVVLRPGEEWKFQLVGELVDEKAEELQSGNATVKVIGVWVKEATTNGK